jgi:hypothetical protein
MPHLPCGGRHVIPFIVFQDKCSTVPLQLFLELFLLMPARYSVQRKWQPACLDLAMLYNAYLLQPMGVTGVCSTVLNTQVFASCCEASLNETITTYCAELTDGQVIVTWLAQLTSHISHTYHRPDHVAVLARHGTVAMYIYIHYSMSNILASRSLPCLCVPRSIFRSW